MSQDVFKAPKNKGVKRSHPKKELDVGWSPGRKRKNRFLSFCDIVLAYTRYDQMKQEDLRLQNNTSPLDSSGSTADSFTSESGGSGSSYMTEDDSPARAALMAASVAGTGSTSRMGGLDHGEEDSLDSVTCFCMKPFGGRPMIECSRCLTWIHLSCAKIRQNNIPEEYICQKCKEAKANKRKSMRIKSDKKKSRLSKSSPLKSIASYHPNLASPSSFSAQRSQAILTS